MDTETPKTVYHDALTGETRTEDTTEEELALAFIGTPITPGEEEQPE